MLKKLIRNINTKNHTQKQTKTFLKKSQKEEEEKGFLENKN